MVEQVIGPVYTQFQCPVCGDRSQLMLRADRPLRCEAEIINEELYSTYQQ